MPKTLNSIKQPTFPLFSYGDPSMSFHNAPPPAGTKLAPSAAWPFPPIDFTEDETKKFQSKPVSTPPPWPFPTTDSVKAVASAPSFSSSEAAKAYWQEIAAKRRQEKAVLKEKLKTLTAKHGLSYFHSGTTTVAFRVDCPAGVRKGVIVELSTAICHPNDQFSKSAGSAYAAINFDRGARIKLKTAKSARGVNVAVAAFCGVSDPDSLQMNWYD